MQLFGDTYFFIIAGLLAVPAVVFGVKEKPINIYGFCVTLFFIIMSITSNASTMYLIFRRCFSPRRVRIFLPNGMRCRRSCTRPNGHIQPQTVLPKNAPNAVSRPATYSEILYERSERTA